MDSSTSASETSENVFLFVFISLCVSFGICIYACSMKSNFKQKIYGGREVPKRYFYTRKVSLSKSRFPSKNLVSNQKIAFLIENLVVSKNPVSSQKIVFLILKISLLR